MNKYTSNLIGLCELYLLEVYPKDRVESTACSAAMWQEPVLDPCSAVYKMDSARALCPPILG